MLGQKKKKKKGAEKGQYAYLTRWIKENMEKGSQKAGSLSLGRKAMEELDKKVR